METLKWRVLLVSGNRVTVYESSRLKKLAENFEADNLIVMELDVVEQAVAVCTNKRDIAGVLLDWNITEEDEPKVDAVLGLREKFPDLPVFVLAEKVMVEKLPEIIIPFLDGYYWLDDDSVNFMAGRLKHVIHGYIASVYPPFFGALIDYVNQYKYAWHTPGHMGGEGFLKGPAGVALYNFFGENTLRSDLSVSVTELGSLLDHTGVVSGAEQLAAEAYNADKSYFVLNGTSTANQMVWQSQVAEGDIVLIDRNCHKSLNYAVIQTDSIPVYMKPRRNGYGIIGPIRLSEFTKSKGAAKAKKSKLVPPEGQTGFFRISALTNSTYDGICYNVQMIKAQLEKHVSSLHFDEAWYAYAHFHPVYDGFYAMCDDYDKREHPPIFCSQSTHKLLTAFSQGSMIHIRQGTTEKINYDEFNEAYMMHSSTSPNYLILASLDVASKMMKDNGLQICHDNILDAVKLRQKIQAIYMDYRERGDWFFEMWQPNEAVVHGNKMHFVKADPEELALSQEAWLLNGKDDWHGFKDIEDGFVMLDPIKLTIKTPGIDMNGRFCEKGIPAQIVTDYLLDKGIVAEKTDTYSFLILHSIGTSKGKQGELLSGLFQFKQDYENNIPLKKLFPELAAKYPELYAGVGLHEHCDNMHRFFRKNNFMEVMEKAFQELPEQQMRPAEAYRRMVRKNTECIFLNQTMNRVPAVMIVPYPPGIPIIMGGEVLNEGSKYIFDFLRLMELFENTFKGYEKEIHGIERERDGTGVRYKVLCLK